MDYSKSVADWDPGAGKGNNEAQNAKLMSTEAHDIPENITANNELKEFNRNGGSASAGPLGPRGHEF